MGVIPCLAVLIQYRRVTDRDVINVYTVFYTKRALQLKSHVSCAVKNKKCQSNLGRAASPPSRQRITTIQSPHWLEWDGPHLPSKLPFPLRRSPPLSNTPISRPTPLTTPNSIQIQLAVLPQYALRTNRQTDQRQVCANTSLRSADCMATRLKTLTYVRRPTVLDTMHHPITRGLRS